MSSKDESCHSEEYRASLTRLPQLAEPTIQFNVAKELEQLHHAGAWEQTGLCEDLSEICRLQNRVGFNESKHPHGPA